jgi:hypothetical protein
MFAVEYVSEYVSERPAMFVTHTLLTYS